MKAKNEAGLMLCKYRWYRDKKSPCVHYACRAIILIVVKDVNCNMCILRELTATRRELNAERVRELQGSALR